MFKGLLDEMVGDGRLGRDKRGKGNWYSLLSSEGDEEEGDGSGEFLEF